MLYNEDNVKVNVNDIQLLKKKMNAENQKPKYIPYPFWRRYMWPCLNLYVQILFFFVNFKSVKCLCS